MFRKLPNGIIQICCMGLLAHIAGRNYRLQGIALNYPELIDTGTDQRLIYCPACGQKLNPEDEV